MTETIQSSTIPAQRAVRARHVVLEDRWLSVDIDAPWLTEKATEMTTGKATEKPKRSAFHYLFLRDHAGTDRHPKTGEKTLCSSDIAEDLRPLRVRETERALFIQWNDGSPEAEYAWDWLAQHAYGDVRAVAPPNDPGGFELHASDFADLDALARAALAKVRTHGLVIVRQSHPLAHPEQQTEPLIDAFEKASLFVRGTHFGRIEDLRPDNTTNQNTDQLGYTDAPIDLHTDQPFIDNPPRYQLLQSIVAAVGGGNAFVDAFAASRYFQGLDERDHELLFQTNVRFHRKQKAFESIVDSPILSLPDGIDTEVAKFQIRFSYFTLAPHRISFGRMAAYYRAHDAFARLVRDPKNQVRAELRPGDFALYDNWRMLHARLPFEGPRWVRGVYFDEASP